MSIGEDRRKVGRRAKYKKEIINQILPPDFVTGTPYSKTGHQIGGRSVYVDLSGA